MFTSLSDLLPKALRKAGVYDVVLADQIMQEAKHFFKDHLPDLEISAEKFRNKKLYLTLQNSATMHVCYQKKSLCLEYLHDRGFEIDDIIFHC